MIVRVSNNSILIVFLILYSNKVIMGSRKLQKCNMVKDLLHPTGFVEVKYEFSSVEDNNHYIINYLGSIDSI